MKVRVLSLEGCPHAGATADLVRRILSEEGIEAEAEVEVQEAGVPDEEAARRERFIGSPAVQIDGLDIEIARRGDPPAFGCRVYETEGGRSGVPPAEMIRDAIRRARSRKPRVLFLCTGNSCRSQMAEGFARALRGDIIEAYSAGIAPHGLDPDAVTVMAEAGIDIGGQHSKHVDEVKDVGFDHVVTVCDHARESCPLFPGKVQVFHAGFDDPPRLAKEAASREEALSHYRRVRDEIRAFVEALPQAFSEPEGK